MDASLQKEILDSRVSDSLKVLLPNGGILALIHLTDLKLFLELGLILLTIAYTIWRWRRDAAAKNRPDNP